MRTTAHPSLGSALPDRPLADAAAPARSLLRWAPAVVLFIVVLADSARYADTDLWGHIRFGQLILSRHQFLRHAPFEYSFPALRFPWVDHEWLSQVILAFCYDTLGIVGLKLMKFACSATTIILLALAEAETGAAMAVQLIVLTAAAAVLMPQMQFRPQLFDYILLATIILMLARETYGHRPTPLWTVVPLLALWANLHGTFIVGVAVMVIYTITTAAKDGWERRGWQPTIRLGFLTIAGTAATLANPYGLGVWRVVLRTAHDPFTMHRVVEYQPLLTLIGSSWAAGSPIFSFAFFIAMSATMVVSVAASPAMADDLSLIAVAIVLSAGTFYTARNMAFAGIAVSVPLARHAGLLKSRLEARKPDAHERWRVASSMCPALQALVAALAVVLAVRTGLFSTTLKTAAAEPEGAVEFMRAHNLYGNVLCAYAWGAYVIWHQAPRSRVFMNSFEVMFPRKVQNDYLTFNDARPGAARVLNEYPNNFVLMPTGSPAYAFMMARERWRLIYRDPTASLFARAGSAAARISKVPMLRASAPPSFFP